MVQARLGRLSKLLAGFALVAILGSSGAEAGAWAGPGWIKQVFPPRSSSPPLAPGSLAVSRWLLVRWPERVPIRTRWKRPLRLWARAARSIDSARSQRGWMFTRSPTNLSRCRASGGQFPSIPNSPMKQMDGETISGASIGRSPSRSLRGLSGADHPRRHHPYRRPRWSKRTCRRARLRPHARRGSARAARTATRPHLQRWNSTQIVLLRGLPLLSGPRFQPRRAHRLRWA